MAMTDPMLRLEQDFARILGQIPTPVGPVPLDQELGNGADGGVKADV